MIHLRDKVMTLALVSAYVAGLSFALNAWSFGETKYDSHKSWLFSDELGSAAYDLSVQRIKLVCEAPGALVKAYVSVKSPLNAFTKTVTSASGCSERGVLLNADAHGPNRYLVESRHIYSDDMVLKEWKHALTGVFGTLEYSKEATNALKREHTWALLREEVNGVEFSCPRGAAAFHYVAKSHGTRLDGDTAVPCPSGAEPGQVLALLTRGSESSSLSYDIRDGLFVSDLKAEYRALLAKDLSVEHAAELAAAVAEQVRARHTF